VSGLEAITEEFRDSVLARSARVPWPVLGLLATASAVVKTALGELITREKLDESPNPFAPLSAPSRDDDVRRLHHLLLAHLVIQFFGAVDRGENRRRFADVVECDPLEAEAVVLAELAGFQDEIAQELSVELHDMWDRGDPARYADVTYKTALVAAGIRQQLNAPLADVMVVMNALRGAAQALDEEFWEAMAAVEDE